MSVYDDELREFEAQQVKRAMGLVIDVVSKLGCEMYFEHRQVKNW